MYDGTNCNCDVRAASTQKGSWTFTTNGSRITEEAGVSYEFCVEGDTMIQRPTVMFGFYGQIRLKRH